MKSTSSVQRECIRIDDMAAVCTAALSSSSSSRTRVVHAEAEAVHPVADVEGLQ